MHAKKHKEPLINYGAKTGFSSTIYEVNRLQVSSMPINEYTTKSEISSFYTLFARINIKQSHYLQTEVSYNISNYTITFPTQQWKPTAPPQETSSISTKITGFEIPFFYGYHILKEGPYGMSFYAGPKAKFTLTNQSNHYFDNFTYTSITESIRPINFSLMMGLSVHISRIYFDFSFEYGLHNISNGFHTTDILGTPSDESLIFDRRKNVLSFSVGFMF
jgi:hypothetical protein